jgi:hypothetical protein
MDAVTMDDWIPLKDHYTGHTQPKQSSKSHAESAIDLPPPPEFWVSWQDHLIFHISRNRLVESEIERAKPLPPPPPVGLSFPPEIRVTLQQAVEQVFAPLRQENPINQELDKIKNRCRHQYNDGVISEEQWRECQTELEQIRLDYARKTDNISHWFLDQFGRTFDDLADIAEQQKKKRRW